MVYIFLYVYIFSYILVYFFSISVGSYQEGGLPAGGGAVMGNEGMSPRIL